MDDSVHYGAVAALANFGELATKYIPDILNILKDEKVDSYLRYNTAEALGKIRQLNLEEVVIVLNNLYDRNHKEFKQWRFLTYTTGGGTEEVKTLMTWLGDPLDKTIPKKLNHKQAVKTLQVFKTAWESSQGLTYLRNDLAQQIAIVTAYKNVTWQPQDIALLQSHYNNLKADNSPNADAIQSVILNLKGWQWLFKARNTIIIHALFWLGLIFAYPKYPQIQDIFIALIGRGAGGEVRLLHLITPIYLLQRISCKILNKKHDTL